MNRILLMIATLIDFVCKTLGDRIRKLVFMQAMHRQLQGYRGTIRILEGVINDDLESKKHLTAFENSLPSDYKRSPEQ